MGYSFTANHSLNSHNSDQKAQTKKLLSKSQQVSSFQNLKIQKLRSSLQMSSSASSMKPQKYLSRVFKRDYLSFVIGNPQWLHNFKKTCRNNEKKEKYPP